MRLTTKPATDAVREDCFICNTPLGETCVIPTLRGALTPFPLCHTCGGADPVELAGRLTSIACVMRDDARTLLKLTADGMQPPAASRYDVPPGRTAESWIKRLRYLAGICILPARAIELREWADGLEREAQRDGEQCDGASRNG